MENNQKLSELAKTVIATQQPRPVVELVYDEETGQFVQSTAGAPAEGTIVTQMTKEGFA